MTFLTKNKKAFFDYEVLKKYEAGMVLQGWEVKSIKARNVSIKEAYIDQYKSGLWIYGMHVTKWKHGDSDFEMVETRPRKLLMSKREIEFLMGRKQQKGLTIVPLDIHLSRGYVKMNIALAKGKKEYEKRRKLKEKDMDRTLKRDLSRG